MQALILAGGKRARLGFHTTVLPKPLVPVGDYPVMEVVIRQLNFHGFKDIIVTTSYLVELIEAYFAYGSKHEEKKIRYAREDKPLNVAGTIGIIDGLEENFLVMNGNVLPTLDYEDLFRFHLDMEDIAAITKRLVKNDYGVIQIKKKLSLKIILKTNTLLLHKHGC